MTAPIDVEEVIRQLSDAKSSKRRSAAKSLRRHKPPQAGDPLLHALKQEVRDPRTWETQYQMIMALAEIGYRDALPFLEELAEQPREHTMVDVALGDAIVRLSMSHANDVEPVLNLLQSDKVELQDGALRAMAMLRIVPEAAAVSEIIAYARARPMDDGNRFWVVAAASAWPVAQVSAFVEECAKSSRDDLKEAAKLAREQQYGNWRPL